MATIKENEGDQVILNVKMPRWLRDRFQNTAKANDTDASKELRRHIKKYVGANSQLDMKL